MKMTDKQLEKKVENLKIAADELKAVYESILAKELENRGDSLMPLASTELDNAKRAYYNADDRLRHAKGWLEDRTFFRERMVKTDNAPKAQIIGDLMRKQLFA